MFRIYATSSLYHEIYKFLPNDTDLTLFIAEGFSVVQFRLCRRSRRLPHVQTMCAPISISISLQQHGDSMLGVVKRP